MIYTPHAYQTRATDFVVGTPYCALWLDMGLGKSVITLTALQRLLLDECTVQRALVIAPLSVARNTWTDERDKWGHLRHLTLSLVLGTEARRRKALDAQADIYIVNRENVSWLVGYYEKAGQPWPFDCVVIDEASSFKNYGSVRWKALWKVRPQICRMVQLTGTPAPNGLMDLWAQVKLLDMGRRLGRFIGDYRTSFFHPGAHNGSIVYEYLPNKGAREQITALLSDCVVSMSARDYIDLPDCIEAGTTVSLSEKELTDYRRFEKDCVATLPDGAEIEAVTAAALTNKLLQWAGGAVYDSERDWHVVHSWKEESLGEIVESAGEPVLVYYNFIHERARILEALRDYAPVVFHGEPAILRDWNEGRIRVMLAHPASVGYGLNLQSGGRIIVWYSPTWNLELYQQANARLLRQGQEKPVLLYHLICRGTIDEAVLRALRSKDNTQRTIMDYLKAIRQ